MNSWQGPYFILGLDIAMSDFDNVNDLTSTINSVNIDSVITRGSKLNEIYGYENPDFTVLYQKFFPGNYKVYWNKNYTDLRWIPYFKFESKEEKIQWELTYL